MKFLNILQAHSLVIEPGEVQLSCKKCSPLQLLFNNLGPQPQPLALRPPEVGLTQNFPDFIIF